MKSQDLVDFENEINYSMDKIKLINVAKIIFDKMRIVQLKNEIGQLEDGMFEGDRADYCFDIPPFDDEEVHQAATVIKGRLRVLGEEFSVKKDEEPKEI